MTTPPDLDLRNSNILYLQHTAVLIRSRSGTDRRLISAKSILYLCLV
jgi:hypothetical protein